MRLRSKFVGNQKFLAELFTNLSVGISEAKLKNRSGMMQVFRTPSFNRFGQSPAVCENFEIAKQFYGDNDVVPRLTKTIRDDVNAES